MKSILLAFLCLLPVLSFSQKEQDINKLITEKFVSLFNDANHEAIFDMFGDPMKEALPLDQTVSFLSGLQNQVGKITNYEFLGYEHDTYASYKANFEQAVLTLNISLDSVSAINGLLIKPYVEPIDTDFVVNKLDFESRFLAEEQLGLIFDNTKVFPNNTQLAVALISSSDVEHLGILKEEDIIKKISNEDKLYEIGSISKVFTATLLADLVINGKLELDDDINSYLDIPIKNNTKLLFKDLSNHTSGLPRLPSNLDLERVDLMNPYKDYDLDALNVYLCDSLNLSGKGSYQYSNLAVGLLGHTLAHIEQTSYEDLLQDRVFSVLGMQNSTSLLDKAKGDLVRGLDIEGNEVPNWDLAILAGAGGIISTTNDLSKFVLSQFDEQNKAQVLTREKTTTLDDSMDLGLGWHIIKKEAGKRWYFHNGATGGYSSIMVLDTQTKKGVVILSNISPSHPQANNLQTLCFELMSYLAGV